MMWNVEPREEKAVEDNSAAMPLAHNDAAVPRGNSTYLRVYLCRRTRDQPFTFVVEMRMMVGYGAPAKVHVHVDRRWVSSAIRSLR